MFQFSCLLLLLLIIQVIDELGSDFLSQAADTFRHPSALDPRVPFPQTATWVPLWCRRPDQPRNQNTSRDICAEKPTQMVRPLKQWKHPCTPPVYPGCPWLENASSGIRNCIKRALPVSLMIPLEVNDLLPCLIRRLQSLQVSTRLFQKVKQCIVLMFLKVVL